MPNFILNFEFIVIDDFIRFNCGMIRAFHIDVSLEALLKFFW